MNGKLQKINLVYIMDGKKLVLIVSLLFLGKFVFSQNRKITINTNVIDTTLIHYQTTNYVGGKILGGENFTVFFRAGKKDKKGKRVGGFRYTIKKLSNIGTLIPCILYITHITSYGLAYNNLQHRQQLHLYDSLEKKIRIINTRLLWKQSIQYEKSVSKDFLDKYTVYYNKLTVGRVKFIVSETKKEPVVPKEDLERILRWFIKNNYMSKDSLAFEKYYYHLKWVKEIGLVGFDEYYDGKLIRKTELTHITYPENGIKQAVGDMKEEDLELMKQMKYYYME